MRNQTIQLHQAFVYIAVGVMILMFTPINLRLQAGRMMGQPRYDSEIQYGFDENGIEEKMGEQVRTYGWNTVQKAVSTPKDIAFYIEESSDLVLQDLYKINMGAAAAAPFLCLPLVFAMLFSGDT